MADTTQRSGPAPAQPPGGGRQDHDTMRNAAMRPVTGPASTDTLAAAGGLDVPGREPHPELATSISPAAEFGSAPGAYAPQEPIPGERDRSNLTHREPGAVGGQYAGADTPPPDAGWIDAGTAREHTREGGGHAARGSQKNR